MRRKWAPVASATSFGSLVFPVPEMPARITNGFVRTEVINAAICQGSKPKPLAATKLTKSSIATDTTFDTVVVGVGVPAFWLCNGGNGRYSAGLARVRVVEV